MLAFAFILAGALVAGALVALRMLSRAVRAVGLGFSTACSVRHSAWCADCCSVLLFVLVAGLSNVAEAPQMVDNDARPDLVAAALSLRQWLPPAWAERLDYSGVRKQGPRISS